MAEKKDGPDNIPPSPSESLINQGIELSNNVPGLNLEQKLKLQDGMTKMLNGFMQPDGAGISSAPEAATTSLAVMGNALSAGMQAFFNGINQQPSPNLSPDSILRPNPSDAAADEQPEAKLLQGLQNVLQPIAQKFAASNKPTPEPRGAPTAQPPAAQIQEMPPQQDAAIQAELMAAQALKYLASAMSGDGHGAPTAVIHGAGATPPPGQNPAKVVPIPTPFQSPGAIRKLKPPGAPQ